MMLMQTIQAVILCFFYLQLALPDGINIPLIQVLGNDVNSGCCSQIKKCSSTYFLIKAKNTL
ncbi:hypothetical protein O6H91_07G104500 [Diphasiastrum complanatum]|uniref:Uncharacterized protein n=1 Tax=Diphasiastrum complanatum TaxID=34168 RepID=A0ACC2D8H1_DIPCM|nr:hypothetical protein O6H91_07G104500 [Diphasiastrum complanatum]